MQTLSAQSTEKPIDPLNATSAVEPYRWAFAAILLLWVGLQFNWAFAPAIAIDFSGWRQADTQSIAENFFRRDDQRLDPGIILTPQINWGGEMGLVTSRLNFSCIPI